MSDDDCKQFVKSFLNFLKKQINERNFSSDVIESIEVATQCLEAAYDLPAQGADESGSGGSAVAAAAPELDLFQMFQSACIDVLPDRKLRAEEVKNEGNRLMKDSKFNEALLAYNKAITLDATNPAFYCNRAAAYIRLNDYDKSVADCKMALLYNPSYSKAYGRMGIALSNLRRYEEACEAYKKALELEPNNQDYQNNLRITEQQLANIGAQILDHIAVDNPDLRNLVMEMVSDPMISMASRQVASRMANQFPDALAEFRNQLGSFLNTPAAADIFSQMAPPGNNIPMPTDPPASSAPSTTTTPAQQPTAATSQTPGSKNQGTQHPERPPSSK